MAVGTVVIVGGTQGLGRELAERFANDGHPVVITGRDPVRTRTVAAEIGPGVEARAVDLADPERIATALEGIEDIQHVVLSAIERDVNSVSDYSVERAVRLATIKVVGYTEVLHQLKSRLRGACSVLLFGGLARERPYPGSTTVTSVNGAVETMVHTFALELAPVRVNALHPGIVGDSPYWVDNTAVISNVTTHTHIGRPVTMEEITDAALFLLRNGGVNDINLNVDGGWS